MKQQTMKIGYDDKTKDGGYSMASERPPVKFESFILKCYTAKNKKMKEEISTDYSELKTKGQVWNSIDPTNWSSLREY